MLRLIGILTGSALAFAALIVAVGIPRLSPPVAEFDTTEAGPESVRAAAPGPSEPELPAPEPPGVEPPGVETPDVETPVAETVPTTDEAAADESAVEEHWYAFWSPFRSEIAANGFIARLQETTGIDYRIVKVKTGVYEVAFAYVDADDIEDKLARISAATGLDMTGS